jgi:hypothetical protein
VVSVTIPPQSLIFGFLDRRPKHVVFKNVDVYGKIIIILSGMRKEVVLGDYLEPR